MPLRLKRNLRVTLFVLMSLGFPGLAIAQGSLVAPAPTGLVYTNERVESVPWSIHVVKIERDNPRFTVAAAHAGKGALGLSPLPEQVAGFAAERLPVAAINGGFYQRDRPYAGYPRGLQVLEREVLSDPCGNGTFWVDILGAPHLTNVESRFEVTWPKGTRTPFWLNGPRPDDKMVIYTPAAGASTRTRGGWELVLEAEGSSRWLPLQLNRTYTARVSEVRNAGDSPVPRNGLVLSIGRAVARSVDNVKSGDVLRLSTACSESLTGVRTALSAGPILLLNGRLQKLNSSLDDSYERSSMLERHPRSAVGWNDRYLFFVVVDGRQRDLSVGMTLDELSTYLLKLGCHTALNLDGGGSSTLWCNGQVRNDPCDGRERPIANSLVVLFKGESKEGDANPKGGS